MKKIIPAILTKDITELQRKLAQLQGITDWVQIDIMDGKFVNNTSISPEDISRIQVAKNFSLEAHLMVANPADYFLPCQKAGVQRVIFHIETGNLQQMLQEASHFNFQKGLALNPETPVENVIPYLHQLDVVLLMSVHPGFGGQEFILTVLDKIKELKQRAPQVIIEVDGGIGSDNIIMISNAGADYLVVGNSLFKSENIQERFKELSRLIGNT